MLGILSKDPQLIDLARKPPWEFDSYKWMAEMILARPPQGKERQAFKRIKLGTNYGVEPPRMSQSLLEDGLRVPEAVCAKAQAKIHQLLPGIRKYQDEMRLRGMTSRKLVNPFGRVIEFPHDKMEPGLYRRLYAWMCQSTVHDLLVQQGLIPLWEWLRGQPEMRTRINIENHDELLLSTTAEEAWRVARYAESWLSDPRDYEGVEFSMPCSVVLETRYHADHAPAGTPNTAFIEWKKLPDEETFNIELARIWEQRIRRETVINP